jgi:hypothetical protein
MGEYSVFSFQYSERSAKFGCLAVSVGVTVGGAYPRAFPSSQIRKSGRGQPQSKTWQKSVSLEIRGSVVECGSPLPLWLHEGAVA